MIARIASILTALLLALLALPVAAHTRSETSSNWTVDGTQVHLEVSMPLVEVARLDVDGRTLSDRALLAYLSPRLGATTGERDCFTAAPARMIAAAPGYRRAEFHFSCPSPTAIRLRFAAFFDKVPTHVDLAQIQSGNGGFSEQLFTKDAQVIGLDAENGEAMASAGILQFMEMGIMHIFTGIDHMSFLLGLVLISRRVRDLIFVVTGFTIGHSLTLGLAVSGIIRPHAEFIDALVALTIALIGMENIVVSLRRPTPAALASGAALLAMAILAFMGFGRLPPMLLIGAGLFTSSYLMISSHISDAGRLRLLITLVFGLIHGFGFAGDLLESRLPTEKLLEILLGFNLGVEIGQLTVVLLIVSLVALARKVHLATPRPITTDLTASMLIALGTFWFVGRSF